MLVLVSIVHLWIFFLHYSSFKGKERPELTRLFLAKLCAVLVTFGSSENLIVDSAQC